MLLEGHFRPVTLLQRGCTMFMLMLALSVGLPVVSAAQKSKSKRTSTTERSKQEEALRRLSREIEKVERQLKEHERKAARSARNIAQFEERSQELKSKLSRLRADADALRTEQRMVDQHLQATTSRISTLEEAYAEGTRSLYKRGVTQRESSTIELLTSANGEEAAKLRYYAGVVARAHNANKRKLSSTKDSLHADLADISEELRAQLGAIGSASLQRAELEQKRKREAETLAQIEQDRSRLKEELAKRKASARKLTDMIAELIAREEAARKAELAKRKLARQKAERERMATRGTKRAPTPRAEPEPDEVPMAGPHSLLWPTGSRKILQGYGEQRNKELGTITVNLGIDISTPRGSSVVAAADGTVTMISALPSYGDIVVISHDGGLHTVYADLDAISVRTGAKVRAGQRIATSGSNRELGDFLHFEVWVGKNRQNPISWLGK